MTLEDKAVLNKARDIARKGGCFVQVKQLGLIQYEFKVWRKVSSRVVFVGKRSNVNALLQLVRNAVKTKGTSQGQFAISGNGFIPDGYEII